MLGLTFKILAILRFEKPINSLRPNRDNSKTHQMKIKFGNYQKWTQTISLRGAMVAKQSQRTVKCCADTITTKKVTAGKTKSPTLGIFINERKYM